MMASQDFQAKFVQSLLLISRCCHCYELHGIHEGIGYAGKTL